MAIAGTFPEQGMRVALELRDSDEKHARYEGEAFTPSARHVVVLVVEVATGKSTLDVTMSTARTGDEPALLDASESGFIKQLGVQLWRQARAPAEQGGGIWARRVQRWRGPR